MNYLYRVDIQDSHAFIVDADLIPARSRAFGFLNKLSCAIRNGNIFPNLTSALEAVKTIEMRVNKKRFYKILSWIPFTEAYTVSRLILAVKKEILRLYSEKKDFFQKADFQNKYFNMPTSLIAFAMLHKTAGQNNHSEFIYKDGAFYSSATDTVAYARSESNGTPAFLSVIIETDYDFGYAHIIKCYQHDKPEDPVNTEQFNSLVADLKSFKLN